MPCRPNDKPFPSLDTRSASDPIGLSPNHWATIEHFLGQGMKTIDAASGKLVQYVFSPESVHHFRQAMESEAKWWKHGYTEPWDRLSRKHYEMVDVFLSKASVPYRSVGDNDKRISFLAQEVGEFWEAWSKEFLHNSSDQKKATQSEHDNRAAKDNENAEAIVSNAWHPSHQFLEWLHTRLITVYGVRTGQDFLYKLRAVIQQVKTWEQNPQTFPDKDLAWIRFPQDMKIDGVKFKKDQLVYFKPTLPILSEGEAAKAAIVYATEHGGIDWLNRWKMGDEKARHQLLMHLALKDLPGPQPGITLKVPEPPVPEARMLEYERLHKTVKEFVREQKFRKGVFIENIPINILRDLVRQLTQIVGYHPEE